MLLLGCQLHEGEDVFSKQDKFYVVYENTQGLLPTYRWRSMVQKWPVSKYQIHADGSQDLVVELKITGRLWQEELFVAKILFNITEKRASLYSLNMVNRLHWAETHYCGYRAWLNWRSKYAACSYQSENGGTPRNAWYGHWLGFRILGWENLRKLKSTFESIEKTFESVQQSAAEISDYLSTNKENFDAISTNFRTLSEELASRVMTSVRPFLMLKPYRTLCKCRPLRPWTMLKTSQRFDELLAELQNGQNSASKLITDDGMHDLIEATNNLNRLLLDIKYNPNKYLHVSVFGTRTRYTEQEIQAINSLMKKTATNPCNSYPMSFS